MISKIFFFLIGKKRDAIGKKGGYFPLGLGQKFSPVGMADKALLVYSHVIYITLFHISILSEFCLKNVIFRPKITNTGS